MSVQEVDRQLKKLARQDRDNLNQYTGEDRELLRVVYLFDFFHKFRDRFDQLIQDQIAAQDDPVPVDFVEEARAMMEEKGFSTSHFYHYFALSFQLRRAFYFISNTWSDPARA